jgi:alkylhydroperoxidase family enzyme
MTVGARVRLRSNANGDPQLAEIYARVEQTVHSVPAMYQALANAPDLLDAWIRLGWRLRSAAADRGLRELAILRVAQLTGSEYVWRSHWGPAVGAGVGKAKVRALAGWQGSELFTDLERAVLALTDEVTESASAGDVTWARVAEVIDDRQAVELVMTVAWYCCVARVAAALAVPLDAQHEGVPGLGAAERG